MAGMYNNTENVYSLYFILKVIFASNTLSNIENLNYVGPVEWKFSLAFTNTNREYG